MGPATGVSWVARSTKQTDRSGRATPMTGGSSGFGARLCACRKVAGLSQDELAERSGLSSRTIRNLESGRTSWPYRDTLRRLADALELSDEARVEFIG